MKRFLGRFLASFLGSSLAIIFASMIFLGALVGTLMSGLSFDMEEDMEEVKSNSVLHLILGGKLKEYHKPNPFDKLIMGSSGVSVLGYYQIKNAIKQAAKDDKIKVLFLECKLLLDAGYSILSELRKDLEEFKNSGKKIIAYADVFNEKSYYVASVANEIYMLHSGLIEFNGLSVERYFFKGLLDKIGVDAVVFKQGEYKSAVEPFISDKMSPESRYQTEVLLESILGNSLSEIGRSRKLNKEDLYKIINLLVVKSPAEAKRYNLIDDVKYYDEVVERLKEISKTKSELNLVNIQKYATKKVHKKRKIAVLVVEGEIVDGVSSEGKVGDLTIRKAIQEIKKDSSVKGLIVRVNSPGGSALASDKMWRSISLLSNKMPVYASFSSLAASGGYYLACACDSIFCTPYTITGSIGVFGIMPNFSRLLNDKLGITVDTVKTGRYSDIGSVSRAMREDERVIIQSQVDSIYLDFLTVVSKGRKMPISRARTFAGGRVWIGGDAVKNDLVDDFSSYEEVEEKLLTKLELSRKKVEFVHFPKSKSILEQLLGLNLEEEIEEKMIRNKAVKVFYDNISESSKESKVYLRSPYQWEIN